MAISLEDLAKLPVSSTSEEHDIDPNSVIAAIFKVSKLGYVPAGVKVRSRIDGTMFTGVVSAGRLKALNSDEHVVSVAPSEPLQLIS